MRLLFWSSLLFIILANAGYPVWLYFRARFWPRPVRHASIFPSITILLAVRDEQENLPTKLQNLAALDYPSDRLEVVVISDGSTDETNRILAGWQNSNRRIGILPEHRGKATAINYGVAQAKGEIIVFTDARQAIAPDALKNLVANFADASVGCVSGELVITKGAAATCHGVGLYWQVEKKIRYWEALAGSTVGATGAFYATRRCLVATLPEGTICDDVYIPLQVIRQGFRVIFDPRAIAWDDLKSSPKQEFARKVRTLTGNYQLLLLAPWVVTRSNPVRLQFVCHKVLRLVVPFALMGLFFSAIWLRKGVYEFALGFQLFFYALAVLSMLRMKFGIVSRLSDILLAFLVLNAAAAVAFFYFFTGRKVAWGQKYTNAPGVLGSVGDGPPVL